MLMKKEVAEMMHRVRPSCMTPLAFGSGLLVALALAIAIVWLGGARTSLAQNQPQRERVETELITVRPFGFEPAEITRKQGRFLLAVDNRSGLEEVTLRLDRVTGNRLRDVNVPRRKLDWREFMDLPPGRYVLSEAAHPEWTCTVTIMPQ